MDLTTFVKQRGAGPQRAQSDVLKRRAMAETLRMPTPGLANPAGRSDSPVQQARLRGPGVMRRNQAYSIFGDSNYESSTIGSVTEVPAGFDSEAAMRDLSRMDHLFERSNQRRAKSTPHDADNDEDDREEDDGEEDEASNFSDDDVEHMMRASGLARPETASSWPPHSLSGALSDTENVEPSSDGPATMQKENVGDMEGARIPNTITETHKTAEMLDLKSNPMTTSSKHQTSYITELNHEYRQGRSFKQQEDQEHEMLKRKFAAQSTERPKSLEPPAVEVAGATQMSKTLPDRPGRGRVPSPAQSRMATSDGTAKSHEAPRFMQPAPKATDVRGLDYDLAKLKSLKFQTLLQEPFDHDPSHQSDNVDAVDPISVDLKKMLETTPEIQQQFLSSLSLQAWQEAGEWFKAELADLNKRMLDSRRKRRNVTMKYEGQVASRYEAVVQEQETYDLALAGMSQTGVSVLRVGTPKRRR